MQSMWLIIVVFFLLLLIIPIFAKVYFSFDVLNNIGAVSLYILCFKILAYKIKYKDKQIVVYTSKNKKDIEIQVSSKQLRFLEQLSVQLKQKIILKHVSFFSHIGMYDAYHTAIITGLYNAVCSGLMAYVKNTKKSVKFNVSSNPNFNGHNMIFSVVCTCFVTIFDILYSLIMSFLIIKRSEKYERI